MIWALILTACIEDACMKQTISWFDNKEECIEWKELHKEIPKDGSWNVVEYNCSIINGAET